MDELILEHLRGRSLVDDPFGLTTGEIDSDSSDRQSVAVREASAPSRVDAEVKLAGDGAALTQRYP